MDRLQSMRVFVKVTEQGGFAKAARALSMSNAVATRHVAELERALGSRLLNRTTRKLSLTEAGSQYFDRAKAILSDVEDAESVAQAASEPKGVLKLYCHPSFGQAQLAKLLPLFAREHPQIALELDMSDRAADLAEEGFDAGIYIGVQKIDPRMATRLLARSNLILCASPDYVARRGEPASPAQLIEHDCLNHMFEQARYSWTMQSASGSKVAAVSNKLVSNNPAALREAALAGMGIAMRASFSLGEDVAQGRLARVLSDHCAGVLSVTLAYPSRRLLSGKVRAFVDFMAERFPKPEEDPWLEAIGGYKATP
jgi:DNA-binding transcriptional LysR family regulator